MSERRPKGISSRKWFRMPRGSRLRTMREDKERFINSISAVLDEYIRASMQSPLRLFYSTQADA